MAEEDSKNLFAVIFREKLKNRAIKNMLNNEGMKFGGGGGGGGLM